MGPALSGYASLKGKPQLGRCRRLKRHYVYQWDMYSQEDPRRWLRVALDAACWDQFHGKRDLRFRQKRNTAKPDPSRLDQPRERSWGRRNKSFAAPRKNHAVIGDQSPSRLDQPKREVGLAAAGAAKDQDRTTIQRHCRSVDSRRRIARAVGAHRRGSLTTKRAPATRPEASRRLSAWMVPSWASTICLEIDRPRPECVPKRSPFGRSV